jgi:membrane protein YqaA with SNARE-associated domain
MAAPGDRGKEIQLHCRFQHEGILIGASRLEDRQGIGRESGFSRCFHFCCRPLWPFYLSAHAVSGSQPKRNRVNPACSLYNGGLPAKTSLWLKLTAWITALRALGGWGVLALAAIDSAAIPIPLDAVMAGYVYSNPGHAWLYVVAGAIGSALGSLVPYYLGRAGGELFLLKRIDEAKLQRIRDRFERQEFLALAVPATLPPPTPFKLFVFSAGVFEMKLTWFLAAIVCGRLVRFGLLAILTAIFGPQIVTRIRSLVQNHPWVAVLLLGIAVLALIYLLFRLVRAPLRELAKEMRTDAKRSEATKEPGSESSRP